MEEWKTIPGYDSYYEISTYSRIRSYRDRRSFGRNVRLDEPEFLIPQTHRLGYKFVNLTKNGKTHKGYIHRLVAEAFIPNPENKPEVNHINGDKADNSIENLEWCTRKENMNHAMATGLWDKDASISKALSAWRRQIYCYETDSIFKSVDEAANYFNVDKSCVTNCCQGKYFHVKGQHVCYLEDKEYLRRNINKIKLLEGGKRQVKATNINTGETKIFESRNAASEQLKIPSSYISNIIAGRSYQTRGWTFEDIPVKLERRNKMNFINSFPGYEFKEVDGCSGKQNMYMGTNLGFGGYVYYEEGMYGNVALLDVQSLHPASIISLNKFGDYTEKYKELRDLRIAIKHHDLEKARGMMGGTLAKYLTNDQEADQLAQAAKLILNSTYGFCSATFNNPFLDSRDKNNIVALKGALFMRTLQGEVEKRGFTVAHIKTDSIKVPDATPEIVEFIMEFAKPYGYIFEFEALIDRMCLVNGSTYIAKFATKEKCQEMFNCIPGDNKKHSGEWTATAKQFQVPYVFKKLFSKEDIVFNDFCETFSVQKGNIYLDMNENLPDVSGFEKELEKLEDKYKKGKLSDNAFEDACIGLPERIEEGHNYQFVGRVGQFCPIKPGCNGGVLYRVNNGKYYAASGTTGYRWLESELVKNIGKEDDIDRGYYDKLVNDAVEAISKYGDFEWFVSDDPYIPDPANLKWQNMNPETKLLDFMNIPEEVDEEVPWDDDDTKINGEALPFL